MEMEDMGKEGVNYKHERNMAPHKKQKLVPLDQLTREELEARVHQLEAHNMQLRNLLSKSQGGCGEGIEGSGSRKAKKSRPFDFRKHSRRHVLLKFAYLGWDYQGYATQEDTQATIEAQLFPALLKTRLIESRETSNYHRCGRTDKGVSAFEQVISITLRSSCQTGVGVEGPHHLSSTETPTLSDTHVDVENCPEINYVSLLNRVLPAEIRMLAWCPVPAGYSARFDCTARTYKYFFPRSNLNIQLMQEAANHLVGYHDYRNFCKMDVANGVVSFHRRIHTITITTLAADVALREESTQQQKEVDSVYSRNKGARNECQTFMSRDKGSEIVSQGSTDVEETLQPLCQAATNSPTQSISEELQNSESISVHCNKAPDEKASDCECSLDSFTLHQHKEESQIESSEHSDCDVTRNSKAVTSIQCHQSDPENKLFSLDSGGYEMCVATIEGEAFLWHQIRCIMTVLVMVGEGWESPSVVPQLLDVTKHPRKPQYNLASEVPLNLYGTSFPGVAWCWDNESLLLTITRLQHLWTQHAVRASMIRRMLCDLEQHYQEKRGEQGEENRKAKGGKERREEEGEERRKERREEKSEEEKGKEKREELERRKEKREDWKKTGDENEDATLASTKKKTTRGRNERIVLTGSRPKNRLSESLQQQSACLVQICGGKVYRPLLSRPTCESLEARVQHYVKKQRLDPNILLKLNPTTGSK